MELQPQHYTEPQYHMFNCCDGSNNKCLINVVDGEIWQRRFGAYFFIVPLVSYYTNENDNWTCFKAESKWIQTLCLLSKTLASHKTSDWNALIFQDTRPLCVVHCTHPLNETKRFIMQPAFRMYGSWLISLDSDWGMQTKFPEGCRARVKSDILQSDVSGSMLWACSITWCLSVILPCCGAACTCLFSAGEQWAAPAAQYDESYLCKHPGCLSHGYRKTLNVFFSRFFIPPLFIIWENRDQWSAF